MGSIDNILNKTSSKITYIDCCDYWKGLNLNSAEDYTRALFNFRVLYTCNTCCIEGETISYHNTRELFENVALTNYSGSFNTLVAVNNQRLLFPTVINDIANKVEMSIDLVKRYHKSLMMGLYDDVRYSKGERPGEFKIGDYGVGVADVGSFPEDVESDLSELLSEMEGMSYSSVDDVITAASYFHLAFEKIHAFADGNGRIGRLLMNYYLMLHGLPPVIIFDDDKETYYMALEVYDRTEYIDGFVKFIKEQMVSTWKSRIRKQ